MNYVIESFLYLIPSFIICTIYLAIKEYTSIRKNRKVTWFHRCTSLIFGLYLTFIFSITISPVFGFHIIPTFNQINIKPFDVLETIHINPTNFYGNIIVFMPIGFLAVFLSKKCNKLFFTAFLGMSISLLIEFIQLFEHRGTDIDDIMLNTLGTVLGYIVAKIFLFVLPSLRLKIGLTERGNNTLSLGGEQNLVLLTILVLFSVMMTGFRFRTGF